MAVVTELAEFLDRLSWSPERLAREVNRLCGPGTVSAKAPYHWLRGAYPRRGIPEAVARVLSQHLSEPVEVGSIWPGAGVVDTGPAQVPEITPLVKDSCSSAKLVQQVSETNADHTTLEQLNRELSSLTSSYLHVPPGPLVYRAAMLRDRVARLLRGHQKPAQRRELLGLGAKFCTLLAWMSEDLGDGNAAYNHAAAAWDLADLAEDNQARRWVRLAQSRQSYWLRNFVESAQFAVDGMGWHAEDELGVFLKLMAARAWAAAGMQVEARRALYEWSEHPERDLVCGIGLFSLQRDRQSYLAGHTMLLLGDPAGALRELRSSLELMAVLPVEQRSYSLEVLARIDIVRARARLGDLTGISEVLVPVFGLEPDKMINTISIALRTATAELLREARCDAQARDLVGRIEEFLAASVVEPIAGRAG
ncbi:hypothetical protein GCM10010174_27400 [Kutzneria viridogrisea]|uniref:XRE family transcriptional regulator n=2 Tax=Kutzneria TaxID=43356 RepID=W5WGF8_9PSEU|nr:hypothetical protein [Kutzneria albida]AHH97244.1 hypothetical protein KALB_3880 [Kutzneria albida DSM 43870]MBA8930842.1 hypothetical protein [Kutzneria viridogrisea]